MARAPRGLVAGIALACAALAPAYAAGNPPALARATYERLVASQELLGAGQADRALVQLRELLGDTRPQSYERAVVLQALGHAQLAKDEYRAAITSFKESLALNLLPADVQQRLRYDLAQLYLVSEEYAQAVLVLGEWFDHEATPGPEAYALLGSAYLQLQRYRDAIRPLRTAIGAGADPKEGWYQGLLAAHYELREYGECAGLLSTMLRRFPDRAAYWQQLAAMHLMQERYTDALAVMELAYARGHLVQERDLLQFAQLYEFLGAPHKAGVLLEEEIGRGRLTAGADRWGQVGEAWMQAKETERAIAAFERARAASRDPRLGLRLGQIYLDARRWADAGRVLRAALDGGELDRESAARAWMLLGIARFEGGAQEEARVAFAEAAKNRKTHDDARQWLAFIGEGE